MVRESVEPGKIVSVVPDAAASAPTTYHGGGLLAVSAGKVVGPASG